MKYKMKPVIVDAVKWKGNNRTEVEIFLKKNIEKNIKLEDWHNNSLIVDGLLCLENYWIICKSNEILISEPLSFEKLYEPYDASNELDKILIHRFHKR